MEVKKLLSLGIVFSFLSLTQAAAADVTVERLDSITYKNAAGEEAKKEKIQYTEDGLITSHITFDFVTNDTTMLTHTYNELGQLTGKQTVTKTTNFLGTKVTLEATEEYTYDANGVLNQKILTSIAGKTKINTITNDQGLLEEEASYRWNEYSTPADWDLEEKRVYSYDSEDRVISVQIYIGSEEMTDKETYTYTEEDGKTKRIGAGVSYIDPDTYETGDTPFDVWKDEQITDGDGTIVSYEKLNYVLEYDFETWTPIGYSWMGETKYTVTKNGPSVTTNKYAWNLTNKTWDLNASTEESLVASMWDPTPSQKWVTEYIKNPDYNETNPESGGHLIGSKRTIYILSNSIVVGKTISNFGSIGGSTGWLMAEEELYTIDASATLDQIYAPATLADAPYFFTHRPISVVKNIFSNSSYTTENVTYHYTTLEGTGGASISTTKNANIDVYFAGNTLTIDTPNAEAISVYSVSGKLLFSANKTAGKTDFTTALTQGVYIVKGADWIVKIIK